MKKQLQRLSVAALISSSVFAGTYFWYVHSASDFSNQSGEKPVAYVGKLSDDILRRPASRLLWQLVYTGEPLYNGEAVRTGDRGEVRIQFAESESFLDLEADSLIVIKKENGDIALDLMEGSLFVNSKKTEQGQPSIHLNSSEGKVDLTQASASLSKSRSGKVDVQVIEGKASIQNESGESREVQTRTQVRVLTPQPARPIYKDAEDTSPVAFQWQGFPADAKVQVWVGPSRRLLEVVQTVPAGQSHTNIPLNFGRHFWKLVAVNADGTMITETPVHRSEVIARYAPTVVFPLAAANIPIPGSNFDMTFKWQKGDDTRSTTLEVWSDAELKQKITEKNFTSEDSFTVLALDPGVYYWRMSSYFDSAKTPVVGKIQSFTLSSAQAAARAVAAVPPPEPVSIQFANNKEVESYLYTKSPQLEFKWDAVNAKNVASWRVSLQEEGSQAHPTRLELKEPQVQTSLPKPGRYIASIEALDSQGVVLATSPVKTFDVSMLPLLPATRLLPVDGDLIASMDGRSSLEWQPLNGAKEYWLIISKDGQEVRRAKYTTNKTALRNLLPGDYQIEIVAEDTHGRLGKTSPPRKLSVPDKSNIKAPTLKRIQVN